MAAVTRLHKASPRSGNVSKAARTGGVGDSGREIGDTDSAGIARSCATPRPGNRIGRRLTSCTRDERSSWRGDRRAARADRLAPPHNLSEATDAQRSTAANSQPSLSPPVSRQRFAIRTSSHNDIRYAIYSAFPDCKQSLAAAARRNHSGPCGWSLRSGCGLRIHHFPRDFMYKLLWPVRIVSLSWKPRTRRYAPRSPSWSER